MITKLEYLKTQNKLIKLIKNSIKLNTEIMHLLSANNYNSDIFAFEIIPKIEEELNCYENPALTYEEMLEEENACEAKE